MSGSSRIRAGGRRRRARDVLLAPVVAFGLIGVGVLVGPEWMLIGSGVWLALCGVVATVLHRRERRRLRSLPPPPEGPR